MPAHLALPRHNIFNGLRVPSDNQLNRGKILWLLTLPGVSTGEKWFDLFRGRNVDLINPSWERLTRAGAYGGVIADIGTMPKLLLGDTWTVAFWMRKVSLGYEYALYDILGNVVVSGTTNATSGNNTLNIQKILNSGMYHLIIYNNSYRDTAKLFIKN